MQLRRKAVISSYIAEMYVLVVAGDLYFGSGAWAPILCIKASHPMLAHQMASLVFYNLGALIDLVAPFISHPHPPSSVLELNGHGWIMPTRESGRLLSAHCVESGYFGKHHILSLVVFGSYWCYGFQGLGASYSRLSIEPSLTSR